MVERLGGRPVLVLSVPENIRQRYRIIIQCSHGPRVPLPITFGESLVRDGVRTHSIPSTPRSERWPFTKN
ncbi:hypothetical protein BRD12_02680 [Halobacteriales archaeon SW_12_67_38]|nr:MAG: hypothetical protein BRD12_02680 [Halobacteriales archaeon SW_12_67_38]